MDSRWNQSFENVEVDGSAGKPSLWLVRPQLARNRTPATWYADTSGSTHLDDVIAENSYDVLIACAVMLSEWQIGWQTKLADRVDAVDLAQYHSHQLSELLQTPAEATLTSSMTSSLWRRASLCSSVNPQITERISRIRFFHAQEFSWKTIRKERKSFAAIAVVHSDWQTDRDWSLCTFDGIRRHPCI